MKQTINFYDFTEAFKKADRQNQFSYKGQEALFDYIEEYEDSADEEVELDVIAICCDYAEYENIAEFWKDYDEEEHQTIEDIRERTEVILVGEEGFIVQQF